MNDKIKIITVDDHDIFRQGLNMILGQLPGIEVQAEAKNGKELIQLLHPTSLPDIILTDIRMPVMDGIEATKKALSAYPNLKIIAISMFGEEGYLEKMIEAGVKGFLLKNIDKHELDQAIRSIHQGQHHYSRELLPYFTNKYLTDQTKTGDRFLFSPRELEILKLVARGLTSKEIGEKLFISKRTVEGHKANMIEKTGSKNIVDLIIYAIKKELVRI